MAKSPRNWNAPVPASALCGLVRLWEQWPEAEDPSFSVGIKVPQIVASLHLQRENDCGSGGGDPDVERTETDPSEAFYLGLSLGERAAALGKLLKEEKRLPDYGNYLPVLVIRVAARLPFTKGSKIGASTFDPDLFVRELEAEAAKGGR